MIKPRAVRISMVDATITFGGRPATLVNISRTGALVRADSAGAIGDAGQLSLTHAHTTIQIDARIVRTSEAPPIGSRPAGEWHTGIAFVSPPPMEITALLRRIISG